jgi:hypothetical protein
MKRPVQPEYFDLVGVEAYTGGAISVRTARRLISRPGGLPFIRINRGKLMIKRSDLDAFLEAHRQEPVDLDVLAAEAIAEMREGR